MASLTLEAPRDTDISSIPDKGADTVYGAIDINIDSSTLILSKSIVDCAGIPAILLRQLST